jgi:hypothetical protein
MARAFATSNIPVNASAMCTIPAIGSGRYRGSALVVHCSEPRPLDLAALTLATSPTIAPESQNFQALPTLGLVPGDSSVHFTRGVPATCSARSEPPALTGSLGSQSLQLLIQHLIDGASDAR